MSDFYYKHKSLFASNNVRKNFNFPDSNFILGFTLWFFRFNNGQVIRKILETFELKFSKLKRNY